MYFEAIAKFDLDTEKLVKKIKFGPTKAAGEVFFHKRENAKSEDDGYLMSFVYDWKTKTSEFVMWDALTMSDEPVFVAPTKIRVPNGFHSIFVAEADLD
jgi:carotenoid cleavage dioxygenase-like enzyme